MSLFFNFESWKWGWEKGGKQKLTRNFGFLVQLDVEVEQGEEMVIIEDKNLSSIGIVKDTNKLLVYRIIIGS